jgi:PKD repeat protein
VVVTAEWDGGGQWQDSTDASGYYTMTLPNGAYTVTASLFGYLPETLTAVEVETGTVTTQDFYLDPAPEYLVSGVVTEEGTGTPLAAQVEVLDTPLPPVATNPSTGDYSISLPQGTYTLRVTAALHQPEERGIVADHSQTQDFALNPLPCILLVDDDNDDPDVRPHFTAALDNLGYSHETFNIGDGPGDGPDLASMQGHSIIIWFSGDKYSFSTPEAGPNSTDEANLAAYLDGGGKLFLSSQDYLWEMALTSFGQDYLGIGSYTNDSGNASTKHGVTGDPIGGGLGPYSLSYPTGFSDWGDVVNAGAGASVAFQSSAGGGNNLDVDKDGGAWQTVFFGTSWVPVYNGNAANGEEVLDRIIQWLGGCGECEPVHGATFDWTPPAPMVDENVTFTGAAAGTASFYYEWDLGDGYTGTGPSIMHAYAADGDYTVTMTATNSCGSDSTSDTITILTPPCDPVQVLDVLTTTNGCTVTFTADLAGDSPFAYDWDFGAFSSSTASAPTVDFGASGTYPYTLTVANCAGSESDTYMGEVTVTCEPPCDPVHGASYDWTPLTPIVGQEVVFTGAAAGTPSITYTWDFDDGSTGEGQVTPHAYAQEGTYTVVMTAANCVDQWVTAVQDVVVSPALVCTDVAGVDLALVTAGTIYTGSIVQFSAGITPDDAKPYSYTVDYGDGTVITDLSADGPLLLDHTYSATGTYQVEIDVWNCEIAPEDAVTGTLELTVYKQGVCVDLVGITISGDASGEPGVYTFTTTYTPTGASETITYTWDNGDAGDTTIRSLDVGIHTLVVTATNCADALVTDTHTIDISPAPDFYIYLPVIVRTP